MGWGKSLRNLARGFGRKVDFDNAISAFKSSKLNIKNIDDALNGLPYTFKNGTTYLGDVPMKDLVGKFRRGDFKKGLAQANVPNNITSVSENAYKNMFKKNIPEFELDNVFFNNKNAQKAHGDLNVKPDPSKPGKVFDDMNVSTRNKLGSMIDSLKKTLGTGVTAGAIFGGILFAGDVLSNLEEATNRRNGCFIATTVNGKTVACKVGSRSCFSNEPGENVAECGPVLQRVNLSFFVKYLKTLDADDEIISSFNDAVKDVNPDVADYDNTTDVNMQDGLWVQAASLAYENLFSGSIDVASRPCDGETADAWYVACNQLSESGSLEFGYASDLDDNQTFVTITDSSIIDTVSDMFKNAGLDILGGLGSLFSSIFNSTIFRYVIAFIVVAVSVIYGLKYYKSYKLTHIGENNVLRPLISRQ